MNLSAESQNWSKEIRLDNRISKLENAMAPKELKHVMLAGIERTEQEVVERYCAENGLDTDEFKNKDDYMIVWLAPLKRDS
jgi:hypothetical protein